MNGSKAQDPLPATVNPARYTYASEKAPSMPAVRSVNIPNTPNSVAMWAGGFASSAATPLIGAMVPQPAMLDYGSYGGFDSLSNPQQQQPYQWTGAEQNGAWGGMGAEAGDQQPSSSSQHVHRGF